MLCMTSLLRTLGCLCSKWLFGQAGLPVLDSNYKRGRRLFINERLDRQFDALVDEEKWSVPAHFMRLSDPFW